MRPVLERSRAQVRAAASRAEETLSWHMPAYRMGRILICFAAFKGHVGVYPPVKGSDALLRACDRHAGPKGNLRFPPDRPVPYALIARIVKARVRAADSVPAATQRDPRAR